MADKTQLTSVKILTDLYKSFKIHTITDGITLQKLVNRSLNPVSYTHLTLPTICSV